MTGLDLCLTPHGRLLLAPDHGAWPLDPALTDRLQKAFARGSGHGLLALGLDEAGTTLPPVLAWWREFAAQYIAAVCARPEHVDTLSAQCEKFLLVQSRKFLFWAEGPDRGWWTNRSGWQ
jgi:hypothetical protein